VYAYPFDHFEWWSRELGEPVAPGAFGENLTLRGVVEDGAAIGDVWRWGDAVLQITEPRGPCYKLDIHRGTRMGPPMNASGRTGWYLRVLRPGPAPTAGTIELAERDPSGVSVLDVHRAWHEKDADALRRLLDHPALGADFKGMVRNVLGQRDA
jgi:MOSC domain-containing protein YiiM